ncbi:uncharacterized protein LOC120674041 isoform X8 [Panicum virgatum]|uniref:uncharacterized protein LOC120674041 isoform X8 n=1 Tax=Panicum virgatum TaxID=38727 RepID=UPI0019D6A2B3|nr:uncharacterized protein LOC120674041 isoform X8 [Panicum virgatum]
MAMAAVAVKRAGCVIRPPPSHAPVAASSGRRASRPEPHNSRPSGRCLTRSAPSLADPPTIARVLLLRRPPTRPIRSIPRGGRRRLQPVPGRRKPWIRPCSASARSSDHYPSQVHRPPVIFGCLLRHLIGHCSYQLKDGYHLKRTGPYTFACHKLGQISVRIYGENSELLPSVLLSLGGITLLAVPEQEICLLNHPSGSGTPPR